MIISKETVCNISILIGVVVCICALIAQSTRKIKAGCKLFDEDTFMDMLFIATISIAIGCEAYLFMTIYNDFQYDKRNTIITSVITDKQEGTFNYKNHKKSNAYVLSCKNPFDEKENLFFSVSGECYTDFNVGEDCSISFKNNDKEIYDWDFIYDGESFDLLTTSTDAVEITVD